MNVLVFWTRSKTTSIVEEKDLCPNVAEEQCTLVLYNNKKYKAKVIKKSYDREYLKSLSVSKDGTLLKKNNKVIHKKTLLKKTALKNKEKVNKQSKAQCSYSAGAKLAASNSIFSSSDDDNNRMTSEEETVSDDEVNAEEREKELEEIRQIQEALEEEREREQRELEEADQRQREVEREREREQQELEDARRMREELEEERERERQERQREEEEWARERQREEERARERWREARERERQIEEEDRARERRREEARERERQIEEEVRARERQREIRARQRQREQNGNERPPDGPNEDDNQNVDPLVSCRRPGQGKVQLCRVYNVWIGEADLTYLQRWLEFPKEMTRRLLKILVGRNNLINMCARGRSKTNRSIPEDIMSAVEYYVNHKCTSKLKPAEFTTTVNMMCATLRNPKP